MHTMTDEQIDVRLRNVPVIVEIKGDIIEAKEEFEERFEKGTRRMDSIEGEMKKGFKDILEIISKGNDDRVKKHQQVMDKLDDEKNNRLLAELKKRDDELKARDKKEDKVKDKAWEIIKALSWFAIGYILYSNGMHIPQMP